MIFISLIFTGCAAQTSGTGPGRTMALEESYKYKIEKIEISEAKEYEVDVKEILRKSLNKALSDKDLLWDGSPSKKYYGISMRIIEYDMGNAFKRWLLPTYGWKYIFDYVARDVAIDLERKYSGSGEGFFIQLDPWLEKETEAPKVKVVKNIHLGPFYDTRLEINRIGERKAAFNVSMGDIYTNRDVSVYLREALQNELLASGNSLFDDKFDITVTGDLLKFWVWTNTTPLYWDIIGEIELNLTVSNQKTDKTTNKVYKAKSESRTYVWPTEELVSSVVSETVKSLMYEIRKDSIWDTF
jgi:hypothetical protein